jgi:Ca2+-binding EF-hand superfamily protein
MGPIKSTMLALGAAALLGGCATTDQDMPRTVQGENMHFQNLDKSKDGVLTLDELPPNLELSLDFARYDLDGDGVISEYEFGEYIATMDHTRRY